MGRSDASSGSANPEGTTRRQTVQKRGNKNSCVGYDCLAAIGKGNPVALQEHFFMFDSRWLHLSDF